MSNGREHIERVREQLQEGDVTYTQAVMMFADMGLTLYDEIASTRQGVDDLAEDLEKLEGRVNDNESELDKIGDPDRLGSLYSRVAKIEGRVYVGIGLTALAALAGAILFVAGGGI